MLFYEAPDYSWINDGVKVMEENDDILCVLPRGGPPSANGSLHQGSTLFQVDKKEIFFYSRISQVDITLFIGRGFLAFFR